jgi:type II secretory pathway pseudopilin PulG
MFCSRCGGALDPGAAFCSACGAVVAPASAAIPAIGAPSRPGVVTMLAILDWIGASVWILLAMFGLAVTVAAGRRGARDPTDFVVFVLMLALGGLQLATGFGLWRLRPYGRRLQIFGACLGLIGFPLGTVISIAILVYLHKPGIKILFSGKPVEWLTPEERAQLSRAMTFSGASVVILGVVGLLLLVAVIGIVAAIAIPGLLRARIDANEAGAVRRLQLFSTAEAAYALNNHGLYDPPECLEHPAGCLTGYSGGAFLGGLPERQDGYRFSYYPGPAPATPIAGASRSGTTAFVMIATPVDTNTGTRVFCVDASHVTRATSLSSPLPEPGTSCPGAWPLAK